MISRIDLKKLSIITTHPIQYHAPLFKQLAGNGKLKIKVFYTWGESVLNNKYDPGFGKIIEWDLPLLNGYDYIFVKNVSKKPGSHHFNGISNPALITEIETWHPDAVLIFGWNFNSHLKAIRYFHGKISVYFRGDSTLLDEKSWSIKKLFRYIFLKWVYSHISLAFYVGQANKAYFMKYGLKQNRLQFAPHAIDNHRFENFIHTDIRAQLNIPEKAILFLFSGKFENKKNPKILLEAFILLDNPDSYLLFVGNGRLEKELKERVKEVPALIAKRILFLDFQNQSRMPDVYKSADIFVLPSSGPAETWGLSVNEAMAASLPVLVSDKCGCSLDLVIDDVNGFVFKASDLKDLILKMRIFLDKKNRIMEMGTESKKIINKWTFAHTCEAIETVIANQFNEIKVEN